MNYQFMPGNVSCLAVGPDNTVYAGSGVYSSILRKIDTLNRISGPWEDVGNATQAFSNGYMYDLQLDNKGDLYAAGLFEGNVKKLNRVKNTWETLGSNNKIVFGNGSVRSIALTNQGIITGGTFDAKIAILKP